MPFLNRLVALCLATCYVTAMSVAAQFTFSPGAAVELPTLGSGAADHATVAANDFGDFLVANHADHPAGGKLVEVTAFTATAQGQLFAAAPVLIGDPTLGLIGNDSCRKPDVISLEDGSFAVCFPRGDRQDDANGQLEVVRIETRDAQGLVLATPFVHAPGPGRGYVVDLALNPGDAGVMPDATSLGPNHPLGLAIAYAHQVDRREVNGDTFREYELRVAAVDFEWPSWHPKFLNGPWTIEQAIPMDNEAGEPFAGGLILPDLVRDDAGQLVVTWEQYLLAPHQGLAQGARGRVMLQRLTGFDDAQPLRPLDRLEFSGQNEARQQRRPNLATCEEDGFDGVALTWTDRGPSGLLNRVEYQLIEFPNGPAAGVSPPLPAYWEDSPLFGDAHPIPLLGEDFGITFAVRDYGLTRELLSSFSDLDGHRCMVSIDMGIDFPWRAAAALLPPPSGGSGGPQQVVQVCEGADQRSSAAYRLHLRVDPL